MINLNFFCSSESLHNNFNSFHYCYYLKKIQKINRITSSTVPSRPCLFQGVKPPPCWGIGDSPRKFSTRRHFSLVHNFSMSTFRFLIFQPSHIRSRIFFPRRIDEYVFNFLINFIICSENNLLFQNGFVQASENQHGQ